MRCIVCFKVVGFATLEGLFDGGKLIAQKMGGKVYLSWTEGNGDLKEFPIAVFKDETAGAVAFSVGAGDGTSVEMESIRLFGLQPTVEILADDWEEMDGKRPEKSPPPQKENNEKSGCSSTAGLSGVVVLAAGAACMLKKKKGNHNED